MSAEEPGADPCGSSGVRAGAGPRGGTAGPGRRPADAGRGPRGCRCEGAGPGPRPVESGSPCGTRRCTRAPRRRSRGPRDPSDSIPAPPRSRQAPSPRPAAPPVPPAARPPPFTPRPTGRALPRSPPRRRGVPRPAAPTAPPPPPRGHRSRARSRSRIPAGPVRRSTALRRALFRQLTRCRPDGWGRRGSWTGSDSWPTVIVVTMTVGCRTKLPAGAEARYALALGEDKLGTTVPPAIRRGGAPDRRTSGDTARWPRAQARPAGRGGRVERTRPGPSTRGPTRCCRPPATPSPA